MAASDRTARPKAAFVYMVRCTGGQLYTGWTNDPAARLRAHRSGRGARATPAPPPVICAPATTDDFVKYMRELDLPGAMEYPNISASASEDFAFVAERVPSAFMYLSSGYMDERGNYSAHNPKVQFNEEVLPRGAAYLAQCAQRWLEEHH